MGKLDGVSTIDAVVAVVLENEIPLSSVEVPDETGFALDVVEEGIFNVTVELGSVIKVAEEVMPVDAIEAIDAVEDCPADVGLPKSQAI